MKGNFFTYHCHFITRFEISLASVSARQKSVTSEPIRVVIVPFSVVFRRADVPTMSGPDVILVLRLTIRLPDAELLPKLLLAIHL